MPLLEFQTALGEMVRDPRGGPDSFGQLRSFMRLEADELECLRALVPSAGFQFTRAVQRSWCEQRAANAAYLTLSVLPEQTRRRILDEWIGLGGGTASFFGAEAEALLNFIAGQLPDSSVELNICRLEQTTIRATVHSIDFEAPDPALFAPERLLRRAPYAALVTALLIAPGIDQVHRAASPIELLLWERVASPVSVAALLGEGYPRNALETMLQIGALEYGC